MLFSCCVLLQRHKVMRLSVSMGTTARPQHRDMLPRPWPGTAPPILARAPCSPTISLPQCMGCQAPQVLKQLARRAPGIPGPILLVAHSIRLTQTSNQHGLQEGARWTIHCATGSLTAAFTDACSLSLPSVWGLLSPQLFLTLTCHPFTLAAWPGRHGQPWSPWG